VAASATVPAGEPVSVGAATLSPAVQQGGASSIPAATQPATGSAAAEGGVVVIRAKRESWVEITDAKGTVAVRKLLGAGETSSGAGVLPLQVTIGAVDATEVQVRGKPFDLGPVARDNFARFQVK
jgi:cytoskeleton protein RodZ